MDVELRPFTTDDLVLLERIAVDVEVAGPYNWTGFRDAGAALRRFEDDGLLADHLGHLVVAGDGATVGVVQWRRPGYGGHIPGTAWQIGCTIMPDARGRGLGSAAHRALVAYLFSTTPAVRLEADTDVDNVAEHRCLERAGFTREGVLRSVAFHSGGWHDVARYGLLRAEHGR